MEDTKREFEIKHRKMIGSKFTLDIKRTVEVGIEGQKIVGEINSRRGEHGSYFFKPMWGEKEAQEQKKKHEFLKQGGVNVVPIFKPVKFSDGTTYAVITDLTENGKYWFYGMNNPEIDTDEYKKVARNIPQNTLDKASSEMIIACEAACVPNRKIFGDDRIFEFQNNAFLLFLDPKNTERAKVYVADLGIDVMRRNLNEKDRVLENNIYCACMFFSWMFSRRLVLPVKYAHLQAKMDKHMDEVINWVDVQKPALLKNASKNR